MSQAHRPAGPGSTDANLGRYARRTRDMTASEIRALFAVASRPEIVSLAGGMPDVSLLDVDAVADLVQRVIRSQASTALQYGGGQGTGALRDALCQVMAAEGVAAEPDDVVVTTGGQQALDLIGKLFLDPGDVVIAEGPSYVGALGAFSAYEADVVHVGMDADGLQPAALADGFERVAAEGRRAKLLYTVPNHQNPAGVSLAADRRATVLELARRHGVLVIEDNPYGLLDFKGEALPALRTLDDDNVLYVGTLSKIFSPGVRTGWVLGPRPITDKLVQLKEAADLCQSATTQAIAAEWLRSQPWLQHVEAFRDLYRERCDVLLDQVSRSFPPGCLVRPPTGGMFAWVELPAGIDTGAMLARAIRARVAYVPGRAFYADGSGQREMRLNFSYATAERIREGVRRLGELIADELALISALYADRD